MWVRTHARTPFHLDKTLPHSTAGSEVPLQLAEVLGEASQLLGLGITSPLEFLFGCQAGTKREQNNALKIIHLLAVR